MTTHCPCGGDTNAVSETRREHPKAPPVQRWWLRCIVCGTSGPQATGELSADVAWHLLTGQPAPGVAAIAVERLELRPRDRKGFAALARELGVTRTTLERWDCGATAVSDEHRGKLLRLIVSG